MVFKQAGKPILTCSQWLEQVKHTAPKWWFNGDEAHVRNHVWKSRGKSWIMHHYAWCIMHHHYHVYKGHMYFLHVLLRHERHHIVAIWDHHLGHLCKSEAHYATRQSAGGPWMVGVMWSCLAMVKGESQVERFWEHLLGLVAGISCISFAKWHCTPTCLEKKKLVLRYPIFFGGYILPTICATRTGVILWLGCETWWHPNGNEGGFLIQNSLGISWH